MQATDRYIFTSPQRHNFPKGGSMQSRNMLLAGMAALSFTLAGCEKPAGDAAVDTSAAPAAAVTDRSADERAIIALDSGWVRQVLAKNVDSLMTYYAPDVVS